MEMGHFEDQARLADAGFADEPDDLRLAVFRPLQQFEQCVEIAAFAPRSGSTSVRRPRISAARDPRRERSSAESLASRFHREMAVEKLRGRSRPR